MAAPIEHHLGCTVPVRRNVVSDRRLKLQIDQKVGEQWAGKAIIWFIILSDLPLSNENFEKELSYVRNIGNQLFRTTKLGQKFSYRDIYSIPNVSDTWTIEEMIVVSLHCLKLSHY